MDFRPDLACSQDFCCMVGEELTCPMFWRSRRETSNLARLSHISFHTDVDGQNYYFLRQTTCSPTFFFNLDASSSIIVLASWCSYGWLRWRWTVVLPIFSPFSFFRTCSSSSRCVCPGLGVKHNRFTQNVSDKPFTEFTGHLGMPL